ncbi:hypothetical protein AB6D66_27205, partial [Vibrio pomeroyi]
MLEVGLIKTNNNTDNYVEVSQNDRLTLHESAVIEFQIKVSKSIESEPILNIGDVPVGLFLSSNDKDYNFYTSKIHAEFYKNQPFLNYFGESEVYIEAGDHVVSFVCDIEARRANALFAKEMLDYLSSRLEDVTKLCFSRTKKGVSLNKGNVDSSFTKLALVSIL